MMMNFDPHTLQAILQKIYQQLRCPQCGKKVPIDFSNLKVVSGNTLILQLQCDDCDAHVVLQASMQGVDSIDTPPFPVSATSNASSHLDVKTEDLVQLRTALEAASGSFSTLFTSLSKSDTAIDSSASSENLA